MRILAFYFTLLILCSQHLWSQSLDDLRKLEDVKKQLESLGELPESQESKIDKARSLKVFEDSLSEVPVQEPVASEKEEEPKSETPESVPKKPQIERFGFDVFQKAKIDFKPEVYGPVDRDYPLGPGDEIIITVWGEVELRHDLAINRQGQIFIPEVGIVEAMGLTVNQLKEKLRNVMGQSYSSILKDKAYLDIALGKLRTVRIFVVGAVNNPGIFTVPAFTSPFHMMFYAGGVSNNGSLRDITLVRNDKVFKRLDFYQFITAGKKFSDVRLQHNDVLVVHDSDKTITLTGQIAKPAIYELKENETLRDLIQLAGGFEEDAYIDHIQIERIVNHSDRKLIDVNYRKSIKNEQKIFLHHGDRINVPVIDRELRNYISLTGPVYGPKRFEYFPGMTIKELFARVDSVGGDAYLERVQITRKLPDDKKQIFSINLNQFLNNAQQDFLLAPEDNIAIQSKKTLFPQDSVNIYGAINKPGKYLLKQDMTLKDLIFTANGFRKDAVIQEAEISRVNPKNNNPQQLATIIYVDIDSTYTKDLIKDDSELFFLQPFDNVFIRTNSDWQLQRNISVRGEVNRPGIYTLRNKTERITDMIKRAGGLKNTAYLQGATLVRSQNNVGQIGIDFQQIFKNPDSEENIYLQNGDRINIPERQSTIKVTGGVYFPSSVLFEKGKGLNHYIQSAGGYLELADIDNVTIRLANGRSFQKNQFLFWDYLPEDITAGSTIVVPVLQEREGIDWSGAIRDAAAILSSVATTILIVDRLDN
ncbi:MAG: hypothetical protein GF313_13390 [Caldithrix sp.]|nr:hypothetical protein [Caldithrix sp.]